MISYSRNIITRGIHVSTSYDRYKKRLSDEKEHKLIDIKTDLDENNKDLNNTIF